MTAYTPEMGDRIEALLTTFKLTSAAEQMTKRFLDAGCDQALVLLVEVLEVEAHARRERRVDRLRRASRLPPAKTFDTLDVTRVPRPVLIQARELARGGFVERADNVLLFGRPGVGKSHLACALGHALVAGRHQRPVHARLPARPATLGPRVVTSRCPVRYVRSMPMTS